MRTKFSGGYNSAYHHGPSSTSNAQSSTSVTRGTSRTSTMFSPTSSPYNTGTPSHDSASLSPGAIAGVVVGAVIIVIALIAIVFLLLCRRVRRTGTTSLAPRDKSAEDLLHPRPYPYPDVHQVVPDPLILPPREKSARLVDLVPVRGPTAGQASGSMPNAQRSRSS